MNACPYTCSHVQMRSRWFPCAYSDMGTCTHSRGALRKSPRVLTCLGKISNVHACALTFERKYPCMHVRKQARGAVLMRMDQSEFALIHAHVNSSAYKDRYLKPGVVAGVCIFLEERYGNLYFLENRDWNFAIGKFRVQFINNFARWKFDLVFVKLGIKTWEPLDMLLKIF